MNISIFPFESLGGENHGWLDAKHHFSFANYHDPDRMGVGPLRVWNDDTIQSGTGFDFHPHRDMEIITFVREGAISHEDNLGNKGRTEAGDVQVMSAGTGIIHSEFNREDIDTTLFQIWIVPDAKGREPRWATRQFPKSCRTDQLVPLASGRNLHTDTDALFIHSDSAVFGATISKGTEIAHRLDVGRAAYLVPTKGALTVAGRLVNARDGAAVTATIEAHDLVIHADQETEVVMVDVPVT
ncbi:MAG: hypothetical protein HN403_11275 [Rhodospirillales bacterium]|jgi:quercetin 2,3-dioxygenase|nr:hypothetical protein [Rhodospirillales bacterium]